MRRYRLFAGKIRGAEFCGTLNTPRERSNGEEKMEDLDSIPIRGSRGPPDRDRIPFVLIPEWMGFYRHGTDEENVTKVFFLSLCFCRFGRGHEESFSNYERRAMCRFRASSHRRLLRKAEKPFMLAIDCRSVRAPTIKFHRPLPRTRTRRHGSPVLRIPAID